MDGNEDPSAVSVENQVGADNGGGDGAMDSNIMDWELSEEIEAASLKIVDEVPMGKTKVHEGGGEDKELDIESFSFESIEEDDIGDQQPIHGLSNAFDVNVLQTAIEASEKTLELVVGKDVVMIAGKTGVGKSTLIQGIAGKRIHEVEHETSFAGEVAKTKVYDAEDALPGFAIGHDMKSKTSSINGLLFGNGDTEVVYLDSPGIEDTGGVEMDIATSSLLCQVAKRCKSLRFLIMIHCASLIEDRGGAFRSVLKFARAFVHDFGQSKMSFVFLFTHTGEITGMATSLDDAKKRLLEEVVRTVKETGDGEVKKVLDFIRTSLKKGYPFAQVFHPLETDYSKLTALIAKKVKKVTDLTLASTCNLTLAARLKLESATQGLVQQIRVALRESNQDVQQVHDIIQTLEYLKQYVEVDCVRRAAAQCKSIIDEHVAYLRLSISELVRRGTSCNLHFSEEHILTLKAHLTQLRELTDTGSYDHSLQNIKTSLNEFKEEIATKACSLEPFHVELKKMAAWAHGFVDFIPIYTETCMNVTKYLHCLSTAVSEFDISHLDPLNPVEVTNFVRSLFKLHSLSEQMVQFPTTDIVVEDALHARDSTIHQLNDVFKSWPKNAVSFEKASSDYEDDLKVVAKYVCVLEIIQEEIKALQKEYAVSFTILDEYLIGAKTRMKDEVNQGFDLCCEEIRSKSFDSHYKPQLCWMLAVCNQFPSWKQMQSSFYSVIDTIKTTLYKTSGELENMAHMVDTHGIHAGENLGRDLVNLESCIWFDDFVPSDQKFVARCCDRVKSTINARVKKKRDELSRITGELLIVNGSSSATIIKNGSSSAALIKDIGMLLPELCAIDKYSNVVNSGEQANLLAVKCNAHLTSYVEGLSELSSKCIGHWVSNVESSRIGYMRSMARKLNYILADVEALFATGASDIVTQRSCDIRSSLHAELHKFKNSVQNEFASFEKSFGRKAAFLVTIKACSGFSHVVCQLGDYKKVQHFVRDMISKEAAKVEASIGGSSEWDSIDASIVNFEAATVLDQFVSGEVSSRLRTLKHLREQKEDQVDDLLQDMIKDHNFKGIRDFLSPLARSKDQIKKQKFQLHQSEISSSLERIMNEVYRLLDTDSAIASNSESIAQNMDVLVAANSELNILLSSKFNLAYELPKLKRQLNDTLRLFTKQITEAVVEKDFVHMMLIRRQASQFVTNMKDHLTLHNISMYETARNKLKMEVEGNVPKYVDKFFKSRFEDGEDLFKSMSSLKQASDMGSYPKLAELYETTKKSITSKVCDTVKLVETVVSESRCFDDMINLVHSLHRHLQGALREHCSGELLSKCERSIEGLRKQKKEYEEAFEFRGQDYIKCIEELSIGLDKLSSTSRWSWMWSRDNATYVRYQAILLEKVEGRFDRAQVALNSRDLKSVQECIDFLECVQTKLEKHVKVVRARVTHIRKSCVKAFLALCNEAGEILQSKNCVQFKEIFADYRGFVIDVPCVLQSSDGQKNFALVNQLLYETLDDSISTLKQLTDAEAFNASHLRSQVLHTRVWGEFMADRLTLLHEEISIYTRAKQDKWLSNIHKMCWEFFNVGRDLSKIRYCALLGVVPSAFQSSINKAFKEKALQYHPDKNPDDGGEMFRKIKDAHEKLLSMNHITMTTDAQPLDELLIRVGETLRDRANEFMINQRYDMAEKLLFELPNLKVIDDLVSPRLNSTETSSDVFLLVKGHIEKARIDVDSNWSTRNYQDLNNTITDLKMMEKHFKAYPQIFPKSWDTGICHKIDTEIESLGQKASTCLQSHAVAKQQQGDFRRCFIHMGFVLVELPAFKAFTKNVMSCVLEKCLDSDWGYSYLFELGLSLQKGDDSSSDSENQIAQMIVSEFSHFREVLTMVWNEEVSQKPAEDVVSHLRGELQLSPTQAKSLDIDRNQLLLSFASYEKLYKSMLGDYLKPDADLNILVHKTLTLATQVTPTSDVWGEDLKQNIPYLLASVFALFTVLKSGASYNRIETAAAGSSELGEKLLMKPHNIQVLTLLLMFGCGRSSQALESQLMQIRTGEGKSIILGAAAVLLALLGFRVRTVCYSEYLSNRDFELFKEIFDRFGLTDYIKYSQITVYAEDLTAAKGDIRRLTESLLRDTLSPSKISGITPSPQKRISGNDEVFHPTVLDVASPLSESSSDVVDEVKSDSDLIGSSPQRKSQSKLAPHLEGNSTAVTLKKDELRTDNERKDILLVDEVDVLFGSNFYGQTHNEVVEFREPEIEEILKRIWNGWTQGRRRLKLGDIKAMPEYTRLLNKLSSFSFLLDNEISLMLDQVSKVDDVPYYLDVNNSRIGYKVMDSISYEATYGYATCFAYLKEHQKLKNKDATLSKVLAMPVSCGQFSYANISPHRIIGVSGTLQALSEYQKDVLLKFGLNKFIYVPSVYGGSNFSFDKAGDGIYLENNKSDFYHRISAEITTTTKAKRSAIVFFSDRGKLDEFVASATYHQLNRNKKKLTENMTSTEKGFVITKAATAGQITLSTAVFGRGCDFFCKDDAVESNGGVHVIQTFLSEEVSEEIQIQGRTARQGKRGSYQMVLLESDLESQFGVSIGEKDKIAKQDVYDWLCRVRLVKHKKQMKLIEDSMLNATEKDAATHKYFDHLLASASSEARASFENLYHLMKKPPMPSSLILDLAIAVDVTGSMAPYSDSINSTCESLISGQSSIIKKLKTNFPDIDFKIRAALLGYRDIDDKHDQFQDHVWTDGVHFTDNVADVLRGLKSITKNTYCGGFDIAEDHIGAIHHCLDSWNHSNDWTSDVKCLMLISDAPSHGLAVPSLVGATNYDSYPTRHPDQLSLDGAVSNLLSKDIDLFFCSFDPSSTARTEDALSHGMKNHPDNKNERGITCIPMVSLQHNSASCGRHIIFVLDESGSMNDSWNGVVDAYRQYIEKRKKCQSYSDLVSVVQFDSKSRITVKKKTLFESPTQLSQNCGGTTFHPASLDACNLAQNTPESHNPTIIFMSDGGTSSNDAAAAAREFSLLNQHVLQKSGNDLELHVIAFGAGADQLQLQQIAGASKVGKVHASSNVADLASVFVRIAATNTDIATLLGSEIGKRMAETVSDKLSLEYFRY